LWTHARRESCTTMGYPRYIQRLEELEAYELIVVVDQDLEFFPAHRRPPKPRPFVAIPRGVARLLLIPLSTQYQSASWDDIEFVSSRGERSVISWRNQETVFWDDLLDSNERYFGRRRMRVVDKLPAEVIKAIDDQRGGLLP